MVPSTVIYFILSKIIQGMKLQLENRVGLRTRPLGVLNQGQGPTRVGQRRGE